MNRFLFPIAWGISCVWALFQSCADATGAPIDYRSVVLASNPRAYFRLGESTGAAVAANDPGASGGASLDGTYSNGPTLGAAGIPGAGSNTAALFSAASQQGVLAIMDPLAYPSFTIEAWIKTRSTAAQGILVYTDPLGPMANYSNALTITNDGAPRFRLYSWNSFTAVDVRSTTVISPDTLYHVVGTALGGSQMGLYVNGVLERTVSLAGGSLWASGDRWLLGSQVGAFSSAGFFDGLLDEVAIYPTVLDQATIQSHYTAGISPSAVPEIDPAGMGSVLALVVGSLGVLERRRRRTA